MKSLIRQLQKVDPSVTSVVDATTKLKIEVKPSDIKKSKRKDYHGCALAVACMSDIMHPDSVIATRSRFYTVKDGVATRYLLPPNAVREVTSFDRGATFTPGTYIMHPIPPSNKLGAERKTVRTFHSGTNGPTRHKKLIDNIRATIASV